MKILNEFGIKPTRAHQAAGYDFYIPNIQVPLENADFILEAFSKSYKKSIEELKKDIDELVFQASALYGEDKVEGQELNILMLYLALDSVTMRNAEDSIEYFVDAYLLFDESGKPGIKPKVLDHVFFNSGLHTAIPVGKGGLFVNKSGKGIKGWTVRAQLVDQDYTGFVHLSLAYTKINDEDGIIYVGDKITQMIIVAIEQEDVEELTKDEYNSIMKNSERGAKGFGSSDEKH